MLSKDEMLRPGLLYFAYGCNMDPDTLAAIVGLELEDGWPAVVRGWRLSFNLGQEGGRTVGTLLEERGCETYGVVYRLPREALTALDEFEESPERYRHATLWVESLDGRARQAALVYLGQQEWLVDVAAPEHDYVQLLVRGAKHHGLPKAYVAWIESVARDAATDCFSLSSSDRSSLRDL